MKTEPRTSTKRSRERAFTLIELLLAMTVLTILMLGIMQMFDGTTKVITRETRHMEADAQARALFDRMAVDFASMVKRPDVDYFMKTTAKPQQGNDQLVFYSEVPGYYPLNGSKSPVSLVGYRLATKDGLHLERLSKGLVWNGVSPTDAPVVYLSGKDRTEGTIESIWPAVVSPTEPDPDYEPTGPQIFRFEYYFVLNGHTLDSGGTLPSILGATPWDIRAPLNHDRPDGMRDVAAIVVVLAVIDASTRQNVPDSRLQSLVVQMQDFLPTMKPGDLEAQWRAAVDQSPLPSAATSSIRIYGRSFPLNILPPQG